MLCPPGYVVCADLSCRKNYDECVLPPELDSDQLRCIDQTIVNKKKAYQCPSKISCPNPDDVVCPGGSCVENEILCPPLNKCFGDYPYRCNDNVCAESYESCSIGVACGHKSLLCSDFVCRNYCWY